MCQFQIHLESRFLVHVYDDDDGILDIELVSTHSSKNTSKTATEFTTWGPDFISQVAFRITGTFHIRGPVLVENNPQHNCITSLKGQSNISKRNFRYFHITSSVKHTITTTTATKIK